MDGDSKKGNIVLVLSFFLILIALLQNYTTTKDSDDKMGTARLLTSLGPLIIIFTLTGII